MMLASFAVAAATITRSSRVTATALLSSFASSARISHDYLLTTSKALSSNNQLNNLNNGDNNDSIRQRRGTSFFVSRTSSSTTTISMSSTSQSTNDDGENSDVALKKIRISVENSIKLHGRSDVIFMDGSWWLPALGRPTTARQDYEAGPRIVGARFFDIDDISSKSDADGNPIDLPHMMPSIQLFEHAMDAMEIRPQDHVIVYGQPGCMFVHRAWYQMACCGHDLSRLHILDGSLADWQAADGPVETGSVSAIAVKPEWSTESSIATYKSLVEKPRFVVDLEEMRRIVESANSDNKDSVIVDARPNKRFAGEANEPRPGLRLGHMPGSINVPFVNLLDDEERSKLKPTSELKTLLADYIQQPQSSNEQRIVASCGSGVTACAVTAALLVCGVDPAKVAVYDGSWAEWGSLSDTPIVK